MSIICGNGKIFVPLHPHFNGNADMAQLVEQFIRNE